VNIFVSSSDHSLGHELLNVLRTLGFQIPASRVISLQAWESILSRAESAPILLIGFSRLDQQICDAIIGATEAGISVVAFGRNPTAAELLAVVRAGALDFVDIERPSEIPLLFSRYDKATQTTLKVNNIFAVIGSGGGAGASSISVNLAAHLSKMDKQCGLIDLGIQHGDLATLLRLTPRHTILDLSEHSETCDQGMVEQCLEKHESGIHLLASPEFLTESVELNIPSISQAIAIISNTFKHVVIDTPDILMIPRIQIVAENAHFLVVTRLDYTSVIRARSILDYLRAKHVPRHRLHVIANRNGRRQGLSLHHVKQSLKVEHLYEIPHDPNALNLAMNLGIPAVSEVPQSRFASSIRNLTQLLLSDDPVPRPASAFSSLGRFFRPIPIGEHSLFGYLRGVAQ